MASLKAIVRNGRLVLDEATDLPEGTEVELVPADWWDALDEDDRERLEAALAESVHDLKAGRLYSAQSVLDRPRRQA